MKQYEKRLKHLKRAAPELFNSPGALLYIGARASRCDYIQELHDAGNDITVIEGFQDNFLSLKEDTRIGQLILMNVLDLPEYNLPDGHFDYVVFRHGPEHLDDKDVFRCVRELERICRKTVVLATPWGRVEQGVAYGNPLEVHRTHFLPEHFHELGYETDVIGTKGTMGSCLIAWRKRWQR